MPPHRLTHAHVLKDLLTAPPQLSRAAILVVWILASVYLLPFEADFLLALALYYFWYTERESLHGRRGVVSDPLFLLAAALAILLGVSGLWSSGASLADHAQIWARLIAAVGFLLIVAHSVANQHGFTTYLRHIIILAALLSALVCIAQYIVDPPFQSWRMKGLFRLNNPGKAGHQFAATLPFLAVSFLLGQGRWRLLAALAIFCCIVVVILTGTRAAWIGSFVGMLALALASLQMTRARFLALLALGTVVVTCLFIYASMHPESWLHTFLLPRGDSYRYAIWQTHIEQIASGAWLVGTGALTEQPFLTIADQSLRGAHNLYLSTAEQTGVIGLALFLSITAWTAWRLLSQLERASARLGFSLLVTGCVLFTFNGDRLIDKVNLVWFVLWLPVAIAVALNLQAKRGATDASD